jgi:two-component system alkaline phosphatase synthesis response regulator PhoP
MARTILVVDNEQKDPRHDEPSASEPDGEMIDVGTVQVDFEGRRLLRDRRPVAINPKAFELLSFLLGHPGQVFSREQLLEHVWGYDFPGKTRTVDVHVHWLRKLIEDDPHRPRLLRTIRGVGYVLTPAGADDALREDR